MQSLNTLWRDGNTTLGAWLSLRDPLLAEVAATSGYDYVCVDMQHGMSDLGHVVAMLHAMARTPTVPIVRVPWNEQGIIGRVLDAGALGVIIPMVNSVEEAERAVAACRYTPAGTRSFGPLGANVRYGAGYAASANELVACIPMIETRQAVECLDDILSVPGIDAVYVGPADLSLTYGLPPGARQPRRSLPQRAGHGRGRVRAPRCRARRPRQHLAGPGPPCRRLSHDHRRVRRPAGHGRPARRGGRGPRRHHPLMSASAAIHRWAAARCSWGLVKPPPAVMRRRWVAPSSR